LGEKKRGNSANKRKKSRVLTKRKKSKKRNRDCTPKTTPSSARGRKKKEIRQKTIGEEKSTQRLDGGEEEVEASSYLCEGGKELPHIGADEAPLDERKVPHHATSRDGERLGVSWRKGRVSTGVRPLWGGVSTKISMEGCTTAKSLRKKTTSLF